ncbi:hypothetical protein [Hymenobacter antarcticus]|uniref:Lipoprotein n=1 Tax=Hymenobacter antarcticus TaxID=486270 RepID=A0ABP7P818_9BACT
MSLPLLASLLSLLLLTGCGNKPDGIPYGVNPNKHPHGHAKTARDSTRTRDDHHQRGMPKGAELNAISNGGTQGLPNN